MVLDRARRTVTGSRGLFLVALLIGGIGASAFLGAPTHKVRARFTDVTGLVNNNNVRIAGVTVGNVQSVVIGVDRKGKQYAEAELTVDDKHWPLHQGTVVAVRPQGVLSNVFVDLTPASPSARSLPDNYLFDTDVTSSPTTLDALNDVFDPSVRSAIRTQLQEGVLALGGNGAGNLNQTIGNLNPLLKEAVPVTDVLAARVPELHRLNLEFDTITGELAREDANLRPLIVNADITLGALAHKEQDLQGTLVHAAGTLASIDSGLRGETKNLQAIFNKGPQSLADAKSAADFTTPLLAAINPHVANLDILLNYMVTAHGFHTGTPGGIDTLRVDPVVPPQDRSAQECGGEPSEQKSACPGAPQPSTGF